MSGHSKAPLKAAAGVAVFLHSGDYDRIHQGLSIAAAASASGRNAQVFFFWWALERLLSDRLDEPDFPTHPEAEARFEIRRLPTLRDLLAHAKASGLCTVYACSASLAAVAAAPGEVSPAVDQVVGWSSILALTAGLTDRFYL